MLMAMSGGSISSDRDQQTTDAVVVFAVGGNALSSGASSADEIAANAAVVARQVAAICRAGPKVLIVHGNGPQVGALALAQEAVAPEVPPQSLDVLGAMTQGQLGYVLMAAVGTALGGDGQAGGVGALVTRVVVDADDPGFAHPTKPIGPFFPEGRARRLAAARGWSVAEDAGRGWRRVVPSPSPVEVIEWPQVADLLAHNSVVIACGGGGIPVTRAEQGLVPVEAVIDKDATAALVADLVDASTLLLLTGVEHVLLDFGTDDERPVERMDLAEAERHLAAGQFPAGSMGPKVRAAVDFARLPGRTAIITSLERGADAFLGHAGTRISA